MGLEVALVLPVSQINGLRYSDCDYGDHHP